MSSRILIKHFFIESDFSPILELTFGERPLVEMHIEYYKRCNTLCLLCLLTMAVLGLVNKNTIWDP